MIKIWHDDVRRPPEEGWVWCRTNSRAVHFLERYPVTRIDLDHDMGGHDLDPDAPDTWLYKGPDTGPTGLALVDWMIYNDRMPRYVNIHSWNPSGADRMYKTILLNRARLSDDVTVTRIPYTRPA